MSGFQSPLPPAQDLRIHFAEYTHQLRDFAAQAGVVMVPYRDAALPLFGALTEKAQRKVLQVLSHQLDFFKLAAEEGVRIDSSKLIWRALARMRMVPQSDLFDRIMDEDVVEVYHVDGTALFKNLQFFKYISMSLEEVYCLRWMDLAKFPPQVFLFFLEMGFKLRVAFYRHSFTPKFNRYTFVEKLGQRRSVAVHLRWVSPALYEGERKAMIFVNRSSIVSAE